MRPGDSAELLAADGVSGLETPATELRLRRTHPVTPLVGGWKLLAGLVAVVTAQNIGRLAEGFTWHRAAIFGAALAAALVLTVAVSALIWWRTTYAVTPDGVVLHSGVLTRARRTAPRERIESVSVERPALARLLGLAKVRIEVAGGADSHLDIAYVASRDAETLRREILAVARPQAADMPAVPAVLAVRPTAADRVRSVALDGVTDGVLIARIPTGRLLRSMLRDIGFMLALALGVAWAVGAVIHGLATDGLGAGTLVALAPVVLAVPQMVIRRIENGWGFVSRLGPRGLRMRRGLLSTRTDSIGPGRIQSLTLRQGLLWRGPGWVSAKATVAGIGGDEGGRAAGSILPLGTPEELGRTLDHLVAPFGTQDDLATVLRLLGAPARSIEGLRPRARILWIARRTEVTVLLPHALVQRSGVLTRRVAIIPRERVQSLRILVGPLDRRLGTASLLVDVAGSSTYLTRLPGADVRALHDALAVDAASGRRYADRAAWPEPRSPLPVTDEEAA